MTDRARALIDTNVLVHAYVLLDARKHAVASELLQEIWNHGGGTTSIQNLCEFFVVVTRKIEHPMSAEVAEGIIRAFLASRKWALIDRGPDTVGRAMTLVREYRVPFWDALISAAMLDAGISTIVTENEKDFWRVPGIDVINPFKSQTSLP